MKKALKVQDLKQTMSSTEIASLTGKEKKNIHRDIRVQLLEGLYDIKDGSDLSHVEIQGVTASFDKRGYTSEYYLDKEHTLTLITGYEPKLRHVINKRWLELEAANNQTISHTEVRSETKLLYKDMSASLKVTRAEQGKETKSHHYSNESEMLNRIVIGMTSKQYRAEHNLDKTTPIREIFTFQELATIAELEATNTVLINLGEDYDTRKEKLNELYSRRHKQLLIDEHMRLEA